ncbi:hypothetical protein [Devosia marina]|uniref:Uncharacterized protein n=1 Tax=Devosia marina TaxID=2683198 RepID=A0A7X3FTW7_9HYPH|nr:hypothetical protein [Devosia marina]MVS99810.1 hypothetical protein [Devosia marina]
MDGHRQERPGAVPADFRRWAQNYLRARNERATSTRINAMYDAVSLVLGLTAAAHSSEAYERAWEAYCDGLGAISRERGLERHPHRYRGAANDN